MNYFSFFRKILFMLPEETGHKIALLALQKGLFPNTSLDFPNPEVLQTSAFGLSFPNPIGLAAGFDKNGEVIAPLFSHHFGFIETGTVTPLPQEGNPKPRLFRLVEDEAVINRMGFNNKGMDNYANNLLEWLKIKNDGPIKGIVGANIGKNKDTKDVIGDYLTLLKRIYGLSDYITINISSPNTPGLRDLQKRSALQDLLVPLIETRNTLAKKTKKKIPLLLKIAPDIEESGRRNIADVILEQKIDGLIISNTTVTGRDNLKTQYYRSEKGGLSGRPLFSLSNEVLKDMYNLTGGKIPLIGAGGVFSGDDAYEKIRSGASLVQLYTALVYRGFGLIEEINIRLMELLKRDGFTNISDAVGIDQSVYSKF